MNRQQLRQLVEAEVHRRKGEIPSAAKTHYWLNRAGESFARDSRMLRVTRSATTVAADPTYDQAADVAEVLFVHYDGERLAYQSAQDLAAQYGIDWDTQKGTPWGYFIEGAAAGLITIRLFPTPDAAKTLKVEVIRAWSSTDDLSSDTASPPFPAHYHHALAYYAIGHIAPNPDSIAEYSALLADARAEMARGFTRDLRRLRTSWF